MSNNKFISFLLLALLLIGCTQENSENIVLWGKTDTYDPFLWKKQVPDTLKRTLCFDFNQDAVRYMTSPLRLGIYKKKSNGQFCQVSTDEMELFVNGKPVENNIIEVAATDSELEVGIVLKDKAECKIHYWYFRPIGTAGLDRINDKESYDAEDAIMEIKLNKHHVMNPLTEILLFIVIVVVAGLGLWFGILKPIFYPTFRVTRLLLKDPEPYLSQLKLKGYRKCILCDKAQKQSWWDRKLKGKIRYEINPLWSAPVVIEPRDRSSVRVRPDKHTYTTDARIMKTNVDYIIVNETIKTKTTIKIS